MKFVDVSLTEDPVDIRQFKYFNSSEYPKIFIGMPIHHRYDQERIKISDKYISENIFHIQPHPIVQTAFFKGIPFKLSSKYTDLIEDIEFSTGLFIEPKRDEYINLLKSYNLSCDSCYLYLSKGIHPIDDRHIDVLSNGKLKIKDLYKNIFTNTKDCFQCFGHLSVFILTSNYQTDEIYESLFAAEQSLEIV